jgi:hypothetical protein
MMLNLLVVNLGFLPTDRVLPCGVQEYGTEIPKVATTILVIFYDVKQQIGIIGTAVPVIRPYLACIGTGV